MFLLVLIVLILQLAKKVDLLWIKFAQIVLRHQLGKNDPQQDFAYLLDHERFLFCIHADKIAETENSIKNELSPGPAIFQQLR